MAKRKPTSDPDVAKARHLAGRLEWLADALERGGLGELSARAARQRIRDAYRAAQPYVAGAATRAEQVRLVRQAIVLTQPPFGSVDAETDAAIRSVARDHAELGERMAKHRALVRTAVEALGNRKRAASRVDGESAAVRAFRSLLVALGLPSAPRTWSGAEKTGRAWPNREAKPRKPARRR